MTGILFGSISSIADTSELQRDAFNRAFETHGLSWHWSQDDYRALLESSGGAQRIADYAESRGETVDAAAVHRTKSELFQRSVADAGLKPRPGVVETIRAAHDAGAKVGFVSGTSPENIAALLAALEPDVKPADFDLLLNSDSVDQAKPDPAVYEFALQSLGEQAGDCVAIEDNVPGVEAASAAGVTVVAFPNDNTAEHTFPTDHRVERVDFDSLRQLVTA